MTLQQFFPYNNRVVNYVTNSGFRGIGMFMDIITDKLGDTEVIFVAEKNLIPFNNTVLNSPNNYQALVVAVKTFGKRVYLDDIQKMAFDPKHDLIHKWRIAFKDENFLRYLRLEDIVVRPGMRKIPAEYGGLKIINGGGKFIIGDDKLNTYDITSDEYADLEEMYDKHYILKK